MKLAEAIRAVGQNLVPEALQFDVQLACGFTPLHFLTFLDAHLGRVYDHFVSFGTVLDYINGVQPNESVQEIRKGRHEDLLA
jgi:hypothetical protein